MYSYSQADVLNTFELHKEMRRRDLEYRISMLRRCIDICDDMSMRAQYARKILRLKEELKQLD